MKGMLTLCWLGLCLALSAPPARAHEPSAKDKCPVCGMFVAKYPTWVASIAFKGTPTLFFDGTKDLFTYYLNPGKYRAVQPPATATEMWVKDYYTLGRLDARKAFYVIGSDVYGPMGKELIPFERQADAEGFLRDHKGKQVLRFKQITPDIMKSLE